MTLRFSFAAKISSSRCNEITTTAEYAGSTEISISVSDIITVVKTVAFFLDLLV